PPTTACRATGTCRSATTSDHPIQAAASGRVRRLPGLRSRLEPLHGAMLHGGPEDAGNDAIHRGAPPVLSTGTVIAAALAWLVLMFGTALYAERRPGVLARHWRHVYALSLAVHCTSWTFYGTVTQAGRYGWPLPPTFLGAIVFYLLAFAFMTQLVRLARESNATSIADLIATRLGKDPWLAAVVPRVALRGMVPYIALQLKAVTMSFATLTGDGGAADAMAPWRDGALYVALAMAVFAMVFGTRRASAIEHNRGLVLAMAFESLFKLLAMLALGVLVWFGLGGLELT